MFIQNQTRKLENVRSSRHETRIIYECYLLLLSFIRNVYTRTAYLCAQGAPQAMGGVGGKHMSVIISQLHTPNSFIHAMYKDNIYNVVHLFVCVHKTIIKI